MKAITSKLPEAIKAPLRRFGSAARGLLYRGSGRECPMCGRSSSRFARYGFVPREDALCVHCGALERHRLMWLFVTRRTNLFDGTPKKILHVAPEECMEGKLRRQFGDGYLTADLMDPKAMVRMDVTDIRYPDGSFDVIFCNHVLEHVQEDIQAMREFRRTLRDGGWAIVLVPITADRTFDDPSVTDPAERLRLFGQEDHVRAYGPDYADRLREAGFHVDVVEVRDLVDEADATRMGLTDASGEIYYCRK